MPSFRGQPLAPGVAIAAAALVIEEYGVQTLSAQRRLAVAARLRRLGIENPEDEQVILVGQTVPPAFLPSPLPGLTVVGVAMGDAPPAPPEAPPAPNNGGANTSPVPPLSGVRGSDVPPLSGVGGPPVPAVAGLGDDFAAQIEDGDICIVDADRGRVFVNPGAETLAQYQAPRRAVPRVFLDPAHLPAKTKDGKTVHVYAEILNTVDAQNATDNGADGLFLPEDNALVGEAVPSSGEQLLNLRDLFRVTAGKPVFVHAPLECLALSALGRAAAFGPVNLVVDDAAFVGDAESELRELAAEWDGDDAPFGDVFVSVFAPDTVCVGAAWEDELTAAVAGGAAFVVVPPALVSAAKARIGKL